MKNKASSRTAEDMAGFRAIETLRPEKERVCEDPFAKHFLTQEWVGRLKSPLRRKIFMWVTYLVNPGAAETVPIRLRFIDDYIRTCIESGIEQVVILGAGFDCRAFRMEELKNRVTVFEVDAPYTQDHKKHVLSKLFDTIPEHVVFVPYRLEEKGFGDELFKQGYDINKKTLFIMEGLVMYLSIESVKKLFSFISEHSCSESAVVFDFLPPGIEDGTIANRGGRNMHKWAIRKGEPFQFGISEGQLPSFLSEIGFKDVKTVKAEQCREKYFNGSNRNRPISPLFSFAHAVVKERK